MPSNSVARVQIANRDVTDMVSDSESLDEQSLELHIEANRLATFENWPPFSVVQPLALARAGFYYTNSNDRVKCAFCQGMLQNWEQGDDPMTEHRIHFPNCPFLHGQQTLSVRSEDCTGITMNTEDLGITTERPRHPEFATLTARETSFRGWPPHIRQQPKELANAGFYYAGFGDNVRCFYCEGGLRNWEPNDDPWEEHAKWFPRCAYVIQNQGMEFVRRVQIPQSSSQITAAHIASRRSAQRPGSSSSSSPRPGSSSSLSSAGGATSGRHSLESRQVNARLDTPIVQMVLRMGYRRDMVKKAIRIRLETTGDDFSSAQALCEAILSMEEDERNARQNPVQETPQLSSQSNLEHPSEKDTDDLLEENRMLKEERMCKICMDHESNIVFLPCGHMVCCSGCAGSMINCPICRTLIRGSVRTYLS